MAKEKEIERKKKGHQVELTTTDDNDEDLTRDLGDDILRYRVQHIHKNSVTIA